MRIVLAGIEQELIWAWKKFCGRLSDVTIHHGSILDLQVDAIVSPANSFGFMDGGIDQVYLARFGNHIQEALQAYIRTLYHGEIHVGDAVIVPTGDEVIRFMIASPTMRVPMRLGDTINPYLATRAAVLLARSQEIGSLAFPGMGTGVGGVTMETCARQMRAAFDSVAPGASFPKSWLDATEQHAKLQGD